ncbi:MAG: tRNA methyltransferase [Deltaproteobacteria bacterium]|nr:MAG: tRNA methyltransferase [Deltaproteobacteria bacterium]
MDRQPETDRIERHVVLVAPEVHWNTGNIGRTCLGAGARLHLIRPLGFSIEDRHVKRAGLDYWHQVDLSVWQDFGDFLSTMAPNPEELFFFTKNGNTAFWEMACSHRMFLVFGNETSGLPDTILDAYASRTFHIPITGDIRCLNLSTAAGIALFESLRPTRPAHGWPCRINSSFQCPS